jgi:hypothetical protein
MEMEQTITEGLLERFVELAAEDFLQHLLGNSRGGRLI